MFRSFSNFCKITAPLIFVLGLPHAASAQETVNSGFPVSTQIVASCNLSVSGSLDFGVYDSVNTNITAAATAEASISVKCTSGTPGAIIYIGKGLSTNYTCASPYRELYLNGNPTLAWGGMIYHPDYNIYQNSDRTVFWGCQSGVGNNRGLETGAFQDGSVAKVFPVYGSVDAGKVALPVGTYQDTVSVWVEF